MRKLAHISGGIYLILDLKMPPGVLLRKLEQALKGGVTLLQIWNNWPPSFTLAGKLRLIQAIEGISSTYDVPLLINEEWELLLQAPLSGVHFDKIPPNYEGIKHTVGRDFITGITCSNDLAVITWAEENKVDYISFCSVFPSSSVSTCEIVNPQTIKQARERSQIPFFLSGGLTTENISTLHDLDFAGIALISGILHAANPTEATMAYQQALNKRNL